jgi:hypothetical protein
LRSSDLRENQVSKSMALPKKPRRVPRLKHRVTAHFSFGGREQTGFVINLSEVGLFIQTRHLLKTGSELTFSLDANGSQPLELKGKVAFSRKALPMAMSSNPGGIGLSLMDPPPEYTEFISSLKG